MVSILRLPGLLRTGVVLPELQGEVHPTRQALGLMTLSPISRTLAICCLPVALGEATLRIPSCPAQEVSGAVCIGLQRTYTQPLDGRFPVNSYRNLPVPAALEAADLSFCT